MPELDLSRIPHVEERRKMLALAKEIDEMGPKSTEATKAAREDYDKERARLLAEVGIKLAPFEAALEAAGAAFEQREQEIAQAVDQIGVDFSWDGEGTGYHYPDMCALSGLPILLGEEVIQDENTGELIIRALLPFPETGAA